MLKIDRSFATCAYTPTTTVYMTHRNPVPKQSGVALLCTLCAPVMLEWAGSERGRGEKYQTFTTPRRTVPLASPRTVIFRGEIPGMIGMQTEVPR